MTSWSETRLDLFVLGTDSAVFHKSWNGIAWRPSPTEWDRLGGVFTSASVAIARCPNRLDVFCIGSDSELCHKWWDGETWQPSVTDWENLGGKWMEKPAVVSRSPDRLDVFLVGEDRPLYHMFFDGIKWSDEPVNLGGTHLSVPSVVSWGPDRIDIFSTGPDSAIHHKWWNGSRWGPHGADGAFEYLGGLSVSQPKALCWGPNRIDVFQIGVDSALYHKWWDGSRWGPYGTSGGWAQLGGVFHGAPEIVSRAEGILDVFAIGSDSAIHHKSFANGTGWWEPSITAYKQLGGKVIREITAVSWSPNRIDVFAIGTRGNVQHKVWSTSAGWIPSSTEYGDLRELLIQVWLRVRTDLFVKCQINVIDLVVVDDDVEHTAQIWCRTGLM